MFPCLFTKCGPLKLSLYSNLDVRCPPSPKTEAKQPKIRENKRIFIVFRYISAINVKAHVQFLLRHTLRPAIRLERLLLKSTNQIAISLSEKRVFPADLRHYFVCMLTREATRVSQFCQQGIGQFSYQSIMNYLPVLMIF